MSGCGRQKVAEMMVIQALAERRTPPRGARGTWHGSCETFLAGNGAALPGRIPMDRIETFVFSLTLALCGMITLVTIPFA